MIIFLGVRFAAFMFGFAWPLGCLAARRCIAVVSGIELILEIAWFVWFVGKMIFDMEDVRK